MKILFDHQIFSYQTYGGISRYFVELMCQLMKQEGVEFELALNYSNNKYLGKLQQRAFGDVLPFLDQASKLRFLARYVLNRQISNASIKRGIYDVFHPTFFDPSFLRPLGGRPFVLTLYDMTPVVFPELFPRSGLYARLVTARWIDAMGVLAQKAARVIAISNNTKADAIRIYGIDASKISVIHLGNSLQSNLVADCPEIDLSRPFLLFVGGRDGYKNFRTFTRALVPLLKADSDLHVICVGGGPFTDGERSLLEEARLGDRFVQLNASDAQLATLYRSSRAFVFPSRYEGFGLPILEGFAGGCPCIVSNTSSFPEIAGDAAAYFDPDDVESMTTAIGRVLSDESLRSSMIAAGLEQAKLFSWEETAKRTLGVYKSLN